MSKGKECRQGSAILIVVLIMSALLLSCLNLFKSTTLTVDLVLKRQEREQKSRATQGVLNYGVDLCSKRFSLFEGQARDGKTSWTFSVGTWDIRGLGKYDGQLCVTWKEGVLLLNATLLEKKSCAFGIGCELERKKKGDGFIFCVKNWKEYA